MNFEIRFVFILLAITFALMVTEKLPLELVAMLAFGALLVTGILTPTEAFKVFSNEAAITVACMFILIYLITVGRVVLPARETLASILQSTTSKGDMTEVVVTAGSPLMGRRFNDTLYPLNPGWNDGSKIRACKSNFHQ